MNFGRSAAKGHHCHDERKECASNLTTLSRPKMHPQLEANECQGSKQRDPWYLVDFPSFKECVWCDSMIDAPTVPHLHHWWHLSMHYSSKHLSNMWFYISKYSQLYLHNAFIQLCLEWKWIKNQVWMFQTCLVMVAYACIVELLAYSK